MSLIYQRLLAGFMSLMILIASLSILPDPAKAAMQQVTVTGTYVNVRSGPGTNFALVGKVYKGAKYTALRESKGWYEIDLGKGKKGWLAGWLVSKPAGAVTAGNTGVAPEPVKAVNIAVQKTKTVKIKGARVNARSGPGTNFAITGQVVQNETLVVQGEAKGWYKVILKNGKGAWVAGWLVTINMSAEPAPATGNFGNSGTKPPAGDAGSEVKPVAKTVVIKGTTVNVRSGPGTSYGIVAKVPMGQELKVTSESKGWYKVLLTNNGEGWIAGWLTTAKQHDVSRSGETGTHQPPVDSGTSANPQPAGPGQPPGEPAQPPVGPTQPPEESANPPVQPPPPPSPVIDEVQVAVTEDVDALRVTVKGNQSLKYQVLVNDGTVLKITLDQARGGEGNLPVGKAGLEQVSYQTMGEAGQETMEVQLAWSGGARYFLKNLPGRKGLQVVIPFSSQPLAGRIIVVDAGHGGIDPGARGASGLNEKDVVWDMAQVLTRQLRDLGAQVIESRPDDTKIPLNERVKVANDNLADIFVSIHANASTNKQINGTATYYYAPASNPLLYEQLAERRKLAQSVQSEMIKELGLKDNGILQANFAVIRETLMPSILVETAFISNPAEEALLADSQFRARAAGAIARGIEAYFQQ